LHLLYQALTGTFEPKFDADAGQVFETMGREYCPHEVPDGILDAA
jgi:hypothetical protein